MPRIPTLAALAFYFMNHPFKNYHSSGPYLPLIETDSERLGDLHEMSAPARGLRPNRYLLSD